MVGCVVGFGTIYEQTRYHMNLTIHIFLEQRRSGRFVFNPVAEDVRSLQDEVRSAFGWSLEDDETSAREMAQHFSVPEPFGCSACLLYTSPSPRDVEESRMPSSA